MQDYSQTLWKIQKDKSLEKHSILWDFILLKIALKHFSDFNLSWICLEKNRQTEWKYLKILDKAEFQLVSKWYHCEWNESTQMNWNSKKFVILKIFLLYVTSEKNSILLRWKSVETINQSILNTILIKIILLNYMKNNHVFNFEFVFNFFITKYKLQSALISKSKKQINSDNIIDLLKIII